MQAVEGFSRGYIEGNVRITPEVTLPHARTHARTHARARAGGLPRPPGHFMRCAVTVHRLAGRRRSHEWLRTRS